MSEEVGQWILLKQVLILLWDKWPKCLNKNRNPEFSFCTLSQNITLLVPAHKCSFKSIFWNSLYSIKYISVRLTLFRDHIMFKLASAATLASTVATTFAPIAWLLDGFKLILDKNCEKTLLPEKKYIYYINSQIMLWNTILATKLSPESLQYGLCVCAERLAILKLTKTSIHNV